MLHHVVMAPNWTVKKFIRKNDKCPIDDWLQQKDTIPIEPKIDAKIALIKRVPIDQTLPPETVKKYKGSELMEFKIKGTKVRALCTINDHQVVLLCGASKTGSGKGKLAKGDITTATNLLAEYNANKMSVIDA